MVVELDLDLLPQLKKAELKAKRRVLGKLLEGSWSTILKGRGMEFAGFRQYTYSDDASMIDWGASLRAKDILVREFEEFKNVNVFFLLDTSNSMLFSSTKKLKAEFGAELLFNIAVSLIDNGDSVGLSIFNEGLKANQLPNIGKEVIYKIASLLQNPKFYGGKFLFNKSLASLNTLLKEKALIVIISDFIGLEEGWERYVKMISQRFDLIGIMLKDPLDEELPKGFKVLVEDPFSNEKLFINSNDYYTLYKQESKELENKVRAVFEKAKSGFLKLRTDEDLFNPLLKYFKKRMSLIVS